MSRALCDYSRAIPAFLLSWKLVYTRFVLELPNDASMALGNVGRPPWCVKIYQVHCAGLDVRPTYLFHVDPTRTATSPGRQGLEDPACLSIVLRLVREAHLGHRHVSLHQVFAELLIYIPPTRRRAGVAEHDLQCTRRRVWVPLLGTV
jgi:hypothetical protein